jgi:hypothetical protein
MGEVDERYQRGQIYTIRNINDETLVYVGSTINTLPKRFHKHKKDCKMCLNVSLYKYIENNDWTSWYIELYEDYPCNSKKELVRREGQVIRQIGTINKQITGRTDKEYREDNTEKIKEYHKKYYEDNKEIKKKYVEENADKISERMKKYYENNAEKIKEKNSERVCCEICGTFSTKAHLKRHQQTKKCLSVANK